MKRLALALVLGLAATPSWGITLDGSISGDGYTTATLQTIQTGFGGGFNEFAGAYAKIEGGALKLTITGKIESFNKMALFFDTVAGGENTLTKSTGAGGSNPGNDGWADRYGGFDFDAGFAADYLLIARAGNAGGDKFDVDFNSVGNTSVVETATSVFGASQTGSNANIGNGIGVAYDSSLTGGSVGGAAGSPAINPQNVLTGVELSIPLSKLGNPVGSFKVSAILSNGNFDFLANQTLGGLPAGFGNLGNDGMGGLSHINLASFDGDQFFTVTVPEPASAALIGLAVMGLTALGRRRSA